VRNSRTSALIACVVGLLMVVGLAACGGSDNGGGSGGSGSGGSGGGSADSGGGGSKTIAVNMYSRELPYFQEILKGMEEEAKKLGWKIEPTFANSDPTQQINQIQNAVTTKPDALVVIPIDEHAIVPPIQAAKAAGVPVITMGDNIAQEARSAQLAFLGVNYEELGKEKAQYIVDQLKGKGKVGWIHGIRGLNFTEQQVKGAEPVLKGAGPGIQFVDGPYAGAFSSDKGLNATQNLLSRAPDLNALYFDNDDIALGGIAAVKDKGIDLNKMLIVATDGGPPALEAVKKGELDATISLCGFAQGKHVMDVLKEYLVDKKTPQPEIYTKTLLFDKSNIDENIKHVQNGDC
jgi:ABC-type sugar transport system substrate-binding protein